MKLNIPFPGEKISWFKDKLGIKNDDFREIEKYSHLFIKNKNDFSVFFFDYFSQIEETAFFLKHQEHGEKLSEIWKEWFASFFSNNFDYSFLMSLWRSGLRHVEINIDHRFITLSYSILRQFCHDIARRDVPVKQQIPTIIIIDKMVDLCLLVETHAFIEATSRCDIEVVRGISHQVRNPLTVIGGNVMRLLRNSEKRNGQKNISEICEIIIRESNRLERMVTDAVIYSDMYQKEADLSAITVDSLVSGAIKKIEDGAKKHIKLTKKMNPAGLKIQGDKEDLEAMFFNIFRYCFDTAEQGGPDIRISAIQNDLSPFIQIEILNKGIVQQPEDVENAFVPFYSSRPDGTGFKLAIARLAAKKSLGDIFIDSVPDWGMRFIIKLPALV